MELLGRDSQLAAATRAIGAVRRGSGRVLGLVGEAGLGAPPGATRRSRGASRRSRRSNKQVAAALYLSENTIGNAVTTIYAKLGMRSRVELSLRFYLDGPARVEQRVDD